MYRETLECAVCNRAFNPSLEPWQIVLGRDICGNCYHAHSPEELLDLIDPSPECARWVQIATWAATLEWGSAAQIAAENWAAAKGMLVAYGSDDIDDPRCEDFAFYAHKATPEEMLDYLFAAAWGGSDSYFK
jgi:hypothetical protein